MAASPSELVIISGASRGYGKALASAFASAFTSAHLLLFSRSSVTFERASIVPMTLEIMGVQCSVLTNSSNHVNVGSSGIVPRHGQHGRDRSGAAGARRCSVPSAVGAGARAHAVVLARHPGAQCGLAGTHGASASVGYTGAGST